MTIMPTPSNLFLIIDGNAIIHRAYHALPPMTTKDGLIVNAVYGFTSMLFKVWRELKPTYLAVTFDVSGGTFRDELFADYKAKRIKADQALYDQIPLVHDIVQALNVPIFERRGYEADDVIGTLVEQVKTLGTEHPHIYIVTGDMDTLQLVGKNVSAYTLRKGMSDVVIYDPAAIQERYGFGPEHIIDYKALRGDPSDNIPGVPGIGEKTATSLIQSFGSLEALYAKLEKEPGAVGTSAVRAKLEAGKESARLSKTLATIKLDVPELNFTLEECRVKPFNRERVLELFQKFEFVSLLKRLSEFTGVPTDGVEKTNLKKTKKIALPASVLVELTTAADVSVLKKKIIAAKRYAAKALWQGSAITGRLERLVVTVGTEAWVLGNDLWLEFSELFAHKDVVLVGHDLKQLVKQARVQGVTIENQLFDIMIGSYLLNPGSRAHDISSIILAFFGKELVVPEQQGNLFGIDARVVAEELGYCLRAAEECERRLVKIDDYGLFKKIEMPLIRTLARMELAGIYVDSAMLQALSETSQQEIKKVTQTIYTLCGVEFNISSPVQLRDVLFETLAIPVEGVKKGKTGLSTSAESLEKLRDLHPVIPYIEQYRELTKLQNTYIDVLPTLIDPQTKRIHTSFNQAVAATGRLSSSDPNLQNIPVRTPLGREIRKAFVAGPGYTLVSADYSQIELRVVASLAQDERMLEIFKSGQDIHAATAAAIHGVVLEQVTKEMRYAAKEINFGVLYGMGTYGLSWRAGIPHWQAKEFIEQYFKQFQGVKEYIDRTLAFTKQEGYCETLFGRRRYIPELASTNYQLRAAAERMAINHPIQGTAADIMKLAMIDVDAALEKYQQEKNMIVPRLLLQVHDELVVECLPEQVPEIGNLMKKIMENVVMLRVPVVASVKSGISWGSME